MAASIKEIKPSPQMEFLREEAERLGITVSALIIRIIDAYRERR